MLGYQGTTRYIFEMCGLECYSVDSTSKNTVGGRLALLTMLAVFDMLFAGCRIRNAQRDVQPPQRIDVLNPRLVRIPAGNYIVGWDGDDARLKAAYPGRTWTIPTVLGLEDVPAGRRRIGYPPGARDISSLPTTRSVTLKSFLIAQYEVTRAEYLNFCRITDKKPPKSWSSSVPSHWPAGDLSFRDAESYCRWLNAQTGGSYRLPSGDEWEVVAQGNSRWTFPWGSEFPRLYSRDWRWALMDAPNAYGIYHMGWYVAEWCRDDLEGSRTALLRGGFWGQGEMSDIIFFCAFKWRLPKNWSAGYSGFRLAADCPD